MIYVEERQWLLFSLVLYWIEKREWEGELKGSHCAVSAPHNEYIYYILQRYINKFKNNFQFRTTMSNHASPNQQSPIAILGVARLDS